jgi:hypothetical protein
MYNRDNGDGSDFRVYIYIPKVGTERKLLKRQEKKGAKEECYP